MSTPNTETNIMSQEDASAIYQKIDHLTELIRRDVRDQKLRIARLEQRVEGPADEPEKGFTVRLDRVVESQKRQNRTIWLVVGVMAAEGAHLLFAALGG